MIVLLDIEKQKLILYKQEESIPFAQIKSIYDHVDDEKNILYVTNAIEVSADDILGVVESMGIEVKKEILQDTDVKYLHSVSDGTIYIDETLKFEGKFDYKVMDHKMIEVIKTNQVLQNLIKNKKIEIIGERQKIKLIKQFQQFQNKQIEKKQVDDQLDSIILKTKISDWDGNNISEDSNLNSVAIDINENKENSNEEVGMGEDVTPQFNTMSELLSAAEGLE